MKKRIDMFLAKVFKVSGIRLDESEIVADGKFHSVNDQHFYVLSTDKPAVGYFGSIGCDRPHKWSLRRKNDEDDKAYNIKRRALEEIVKQGLDSFCAVHQATLPSAAEPPSDEAVIMRLASLTVCEYERIRKSESSKLGSRVSSLDKLVESARRARKKVRYSDSSNIGEQLKFNL